MGFSGEGKFFVHALWVVHIGDRRWKVILAGQETIFGITGQIDFVLLSEGGNGKGVLAQGVGQTIMIYGRKQRFPQRQV